MSQETVDRFHALYYDSRDRTRRNTSWMGFRTYKCPLDMWIYEILCELRPDLVIECGTAEGGTTLYIAHILDLIGKGDVITVDLAPAAHPPSHSRIHYLHGSSTDPAIVRHLEDAARGKGTVIAILDSNHTREHVAEELRLYHRLVTPDSYLIEGEEALDAETIEMAAGIAYKPAKPLDNADLSYAWRKRMARIEVARALRQVAGPPTGELPPATMPA